VGVATLSGSGALITAGVDWMNPAGSPMHGDYRMKLVGTDGTDELLWARNRLVLTDLAPHDVPLPAGRRPAGLALKALAAGNRTSPHRAVCWLRGSSCSGNGPPRTAAYRSLGRLPDRREVSCVSP
jgi:hypothetical protein